MALPTTPQPEDTHTQDWMEAMELLLGQMALVMECEDRKGFTLAKLLRWSELCSQRMQETGSVRPGVVAQLRRIAGGIAR